MTTAIPLEDLYAPTADPAPVLNGDEREFIREMMGEVLARAGRNSPGPLAAAVDAFSSCISQIAIGQRTIAPPAEPEPEAKRGAQKGNRNSVSHGLTSKTHSLIEGEDPTEYEELRFAFFTAFRPVNLAEEDLVLSIVNDRWRIRRIKRLEARLLESTIEQCDGDLGKAADYEQIEKTLALYARYQSTLDMSVRRTRKLLEDMRKDADSAIDRLWYEAQRADRREEVSPEAASAETGSPEDPAPEEESKITKRIVPMPLELSETDTPACLESRENTKRTDPPAIPRIITAA